MNLSGGLHLTNGSFAHEGPEYDNLRSYGDSNYGDDSEYTSEYNGTEKGYLYDYDGGYFYDYPEDRAVNSINSVSTRNAYNLDSDAIDSFGTIVDWCFPCQKGT